MTHECRSFSATQAVQRQGVSQNASLLMWGGMYIKVLFIQIVVYPLYLYLYVIHLQLDTMVQFEKCITVNYKTCSSDQPIRLLETPF